MTAKERGEVEQEKIAILVLSALALVFYALWRRARRLLKQSRFMKQSQAVKYGKISEQFLPLEKAYPYDSSGFRFLGSPIDGIQFENDRLIIVEFKTSGAQLTTKQKQIKELVRQKRVDFEEIRI